MAYDTGAGGLVRVQPLIPDQRLQAIYSRLTQWPQTYAQIGSNVGEYVDCLKIDGVTYLADANAARAECDGWADAHMEVFPPAAFPRLKQIASELLPPPMYPDGPVWGNYPQYQSTNLPGPEPVNTYNYLRAKALSLTDGAVIWQMYGIELALAVDKCLNFGAHGGRPADT